MNFDYGVPVAKIINSKSHKERTLFVNEDEDDSNFSVYHAKTNEVVQQIPNKDTERQVLYITGQSGSGKSYYAKQYAMEYNKMFKKRTVYLFSTIQDNDKSLAGIKNLKRVLLNDDFLDYDYDAEDFKDCLVICDDVDCLVEKNMKNKMKEILLMILQTGRHNGTSVIYCSHNACMGQDTKIILNECHSITIFVKSTGGRALMYLLQNYLSLDKKQIEHIKKVKSRWITIVKSYPNVVLAQHEAYVLN